MSATSIAYTVMISAMLAAAATAQSPAPSPSLALSPEAPGPYYYGAPSQAFDCFTYLLNVSDCLTFVVSSSVLTKPEAECCPELASLVNTQPICWCELLGNSGSLLGISIDMNRALKLPSLCNVSTPPVSLCEDIGIPVSAPAPGAEETATPPFSSGLI